MKRALPLLLLLAVFAVQTRTLATDTKGFGMVQPPSLPVVTKNILPGEGWALGTYRLRRQAVVFDTWKPLRRRIALLQTGTLVSMLSGLSEVSKPDVITVTSPIPDLHLNPGDNLLRYTYRGEGFADFWAKGRWYSNIDGGFVANADGSGCQSNCKARVVESGRKSWWFRVRLPDGRTGWTDALESLNQN